MTDYRATSDGQATPTKKGTAEDAAYKAAHNGFMTLVFRAVNQMAHAAITPIDGGVRVFPI